MPQCEIVNICDDQYDVQHVKYDETYFAHSLARNCDVENPFFIAPVDELNDSVRLSRLILP